MPYTTVVAGTTITAAWGNANVRDQVITPFANVAARDSQITAPVNGQYCTTTDTGWLWRYNGTKWLRQEEVIVKAADTAFASLTTLTDDATLLFPVDINSTYQFDFEILWSAGATPKYAHGLRFPAGCRMDYSRSALDTAGVVFRDAQVNVASGSGVTVAAPTATGTGSTTFRGIIVTGATSGSVVFQAAQSVSSATTCTTQRGSVVKHRQIS